MAIYLLKYLMRYSVAAVQDALRDVNEQRFIIESADYKSEEELTKLTNITSRLGSTPVSGGGNRVDEALVEGISRRQSIDANKKEAEATINELEHYMSHLTEEERYILKTSYIDDNDDWISEVNSKLHIEQAEIYRKRKAATKRLARLAYGWSNDLWWKKDKWR